MNIHYSKYTHDMAKWKTFIFSAPWWHQHLLVVYTLWLLTLIFTIEWEIWVYFEKPLAQRSEASAIRYTGKHHPFQVECIIWSIDVHNIRHGDAIRIILPSYKEIPQIIPNVVPVNPHQHVTTKWLVSAVS